MDRKINWLLAGQVSSKLSLPQALLLTCPHFRFHRLRCCCLDRHYTWVWNSLIGLIILRFIYLSHSCTRCETLEVNNFEFIQTRHFGNNNSLFYLGICSYLLQVVGHCSTIRIAFPQDDLVFYFLFWCFGILWSY